MRKRNIIITPRDVDIFRTLASGPCTSLFIRDELKKFKHFKLGKKNDKEKDKEDASIFDREYFALIVRMSKLKDAGYIKSRRYARKKGKGVFALYALTSKSIDVLVVEGFEEEFVRSTALPKSDLVSHELQVANVVRTIKKEASKLFYNLEMDDENALKQKTHGGKKGVRYPDLFVNLSFKLSEEDVYVVNLALEVDNDTIRESVIAERLFCLYEQRKWTTMVLCHTLKRIERISIALLRRIESEKESLKDNEKIEKIEKIKTKVFFALNHDFVAKGFMGTDWVSVEGRKWSVLPKNLRDSDSP